ncbi:DUF416 family protein [Sedimenticola sp.]|uniref:DUF416 family protein n=1 Tax=Sedimenticola sp. TaxID=1940285 RepID=UPI003D10965F
MRIILEHQNKVALEMSGLSTVQKALFLCAVCQRQIPVYEMFSVGQSWDNHVELRALLDICWDWAISFGRTDKPSEPIPEKFIDVSFNQSSSELAIEAFSSAEYLTHLIVSEVSDGTAPPVEYAFTILDSYVYEKLGLISISQENDRLVDSSELVVQEMERQNEHLLKVSAENWKMDDWDGFRKDAEEQSLLR